MADSGTPIIRQWIYMMNDGSPVIDWGDGKVQDMYTGDFMPFEERDYSHGITDRELDVLKNAGRVASYDANNVFVNSLPEPPREMIE
ncbi:MAG: hypothetical protein N2C13_00420 [Chloroflexota bacterium]